MLGPSQRWDVAYDLGVGDNPVKIPNGVPVNGQLALFELHVRSRAQHCQSPGNCASPYTLQTDIFEFILWEQNSVTSAVYADTLFDVNDQMQGDYRPAHVTSVFSYLSGAPPVFEAEGYSDKFIIEPGFQTSCPTVNSVKGTEKFAIHTFDFFPVYPGGAVYTPGSKSYLLKQNGIKSAGGVRWPRASGTNNGFKFWYGCGLPKVVRDVVRFCPGRPVHSLYRLPFQHNLTMECGQGNFSGCKSAACGQGLFGCCSNTSFLAGNSHDLVHAYDFSSFGGCGSPVVAARAGVVISAIGSCNIQRVFGDCPYSCGVAACCQFNFCCGNEVVIRHQDDSLGIYYHFLTNSVIVNTGQIVRRGQTIGLEGSTGNSSGPHVHFQVEDGNKNELALFETTLHQCFAPARDAFMISFNQDCQGNCQDPNVVCPP